MRYVATRFHKIILRTCKTNGFGKLFECIVSASCHFASDL